MTVGELVAARANALGTGTCIPAPGDEGVVPATVPPHMVEDILRDLGIWDAEVLEFQSVMDAEGFEHEWHQVDGDAWAGNRALEAFGGPVATRVGQRVRTIVLKEEEENG